MTRVEAAAGLLLFTGVTLLLSRVRWFRRPPTVERLRPYVPGGFGLRSRRGLWSVESFRDVVAPLSSGAGNALARVFGVNEDLDRKLERIHSPVDASAFRTRQVGASLLVLSAVVAVALVVALPAQVTLCLAVVAPMLTFLVLEQRVVAASEARQRRLARELPVVAEQLGMLLSAGYSLGGALHRVAGRGDGVVAHDLRRVVARVRQGLSEDKALREWADLADVDALDRLVSVLSLDRDATDIGNLIGDEARAGRRDTHRDLITTIERRDQQVWIPVAIAALVPGSILIAVPFVQAMRLFSAG